MTSPLASGRSEWEATVDDWKADIEALSDDELVASFGPVAEDAHPTEPGMVLGSRCNVCDRPLTVAGCPPCVTCCEREP